MLLGEHGLTLREVARLLRDFFTPRYVIHLESELARAQGENTRLQIKLEQALKPTPAVVIPRTFPVVQPQQLKTSWEKFRDAEIARQEAEELNGTSSN